MGGHLQIHQHQFPELQFLSGLLLGHGLFVVAWQGNNEIRRLRALLQLGLDVFDALVKAGFHDVFLLPLAQRDGCEFLPVEQDIKEEEQRVLKAGILRAYHGKVHQIALRQVFDKILLEFERQCLTLR